MDKYGKEIDILLKDLHSADDVDRAIACKALGQHPEYFEQIEALCSDPSPHVRSAALTALANFPDFAEVALDNAHAALRDENPYVVESALDVYIQHRPHRDSDEIKRLVLSKNPRIRQKAYHALGAVGDYENKHILAAGLREKNHKARLGAARGVRVLSATELLPQVNKAIRKELSKENTDYLFLKELVAGAVKCDGSERDERLFERVLREKERVRSAAAKAIGELKIHSARESLENALTDASATLRRSSVAALEKIGPEESIHLIRDMLNDSDEGVVGAACKALASAKDKASLEKLKTLVFHTKPIIRQSAFFAVAEISKKEAQSMAKRLLSDNNQKMRALAANYFEENPITKPDPPFIPTEEDDREFSELDISLRPGQAEFRADLITAHGLRCMISGCRVAEVIEAAHIVPYRGEKENNVHNGLLLRSDIHKLFDRHLIGIDPNDLMIHVSPRLSGTEYGDLGKESLQTSNPSVIGAEALEYAWREFQSASETSEIE